MDTVGLQAQTADDDRDLLRGAVSELRRLTRVEVAFAGGAQAGGLCLSEFEGTRTRALVGLEVARGTGLGGQVLRCGRPAQVDDYHKDQGISHDYDPHVAAEGLHAVLAVPVFVAGGVGAVLYGGTRGREALGERTVDLAMAVAGRAGLELQGRLEGRRRAAARVKPAVPGGHGMHLRSGVREAQVKLRALADDVEEDVIRRRIDEVLALLTDADGGATGRASQVSLTPRELDVLLQVAEGCTNAEAGRRLGLAAETVKAYLRSVSRKLGTHTRGEAVACARRAGLLAR